jgi:ribonuclease HI
MRPVVIHTDGACLGNPGPGGWAAILQSGSVRRDLSGAERKTTNNRMELTAAIRGLEAITEPCAVRIVTDSTYLRDGITSWIARWKKNGWRTSTKAPVKNRDLWERLDALTARHRVEWEWTKAHIGDPMNELADRLATMAARSVADD